MHETFFWMRTQASSRNPLHIQGNKKIPLVKMSKRTSHMTNGTTTPAKATAVTPESKSSKTTASQADESSSLVLLPDTLSNEKYEQACDFIKLAAKTYDWDDNAVIQLGFGMFSGVDDVKNQDFFTHNYTKVRGPEVRSSSGKNSIIDWWGGSDKGLDFTLFTHKETGDMVLAFRGTEPLSVEDWIQDMKQAFGEAQTYKDAVDLAKSLKKKAQQNHKTLRIAGHSLGGGLATAAALGTGCEAIVFNAAGLSDDTIQNLGLDIEHAPNITNINVQDCFVSDHNKKMDRTTIGNHALGGIVTNQKQYGPQIWLKSISDRANFILLPDWTRTVKRAESVLNHACQTIAYQLEHKQFVVPPEEVIAAASEEEKETVVEPRAKKQKTSK